MDDKIQNNNSFQKLRSEMENYEKLEKFSWIFPGLRKVFKENSEKFKNMKEQLKLLSETPDRFNEYFAEKGWIAYESMNTEVMDEAVQLANQGKREEAENKLIEYYNPDNIDKRLLYLRRIKEFSIRHNFIRYAYEDYRAERYYACIPLLLMIIDGVVNDVGKNHGFFSEGSNLVAWDSIAAHSTGLNTIKEIFSKTRNSTKTEEITLPYRNGILHGRDLGYANRIIAAKCWSTLFALNDWAQALKEGKKNPPPKEEDPSLGEMWNSLKETVKGYKRTQEAKKRINEWEAREIIIGVDCPESGTSLDYEELTPEKEVVLFFEYWRNRKYGLIAQRVNRLVNKESLSKEAGKIRTILEDKTLLSYKITGIKDDAPAISEIYVDVEMEYEGNVYTKNLKFRCCCKGADNEILIFGDPGGTWMYFDFFLNDIAYCFVNR